MLRGPNPDGGREWLKETTTLPKHCNTLIPPFTNVQLIDFRENSTPYASWSFATTKHFSLQLKAPGFRPASAWQGTSDQNSYRPLPILQKNLVLWGNISVI